MHQRLYEKRRTIVTAEYEPNDEECDFTLDDETEEEEDKELCQDLKEKAKVEDNKPVHEFTEETKGESKILVKN